MLGKKKDGAYSVTEIKLPPKSRPSRGQKAVENILKMVIKDLKSEQINQDFIKEILLINEHQYKYKNQ